MVVALVIFYEIMQKYYKYYINIKNYNKDIIKFYNDLVLHQKFQ